MTQSAVAIANLLYRAELLDAGGLPGVVKLFRHNESPAG